MANDTENGRAIAWTTLKRDTRNMTIAYFILQNLPTLTTWIDDAGIAYLFRRFTIHTATVTVMRGDAIAVRGKSPADRVPNLAGQYSLPPLC